MKRKIPLLTLLSLSITLFSCGGASQEKEIQFDYIFTAQPVVAATNSTIFKNVQNDFADKYNNQKLTQASIFVRNGADTQSVNALLAKINADIVAGVAAPMLIKTAIEKVGSTEEQTSKFGVPGAMAMKVTAANNGFSLGYNNALLIKDDISNFVSLITNNNLGELSNDIFYVPSLPEEGSSYESLKILAPTGAPSIAFYNFAESENFTTTTNPQEGLIPMFKTNTYDVIVAPTHGGLTQIVKQNAKYKIAATITFGNFYIVATGHDEDGILNEGDKVLIFQINDVPGRIFDVVYGDLNLNLTAVNAVSDTKVVIENGGILKL